LGGRVKNGGLHIIFEEIRKKAKIRSCVQPAQNLREKKGKNLADGGRERGADARKREPAISR